MVVMRVSEFNMMMNTFTRLDFDEFVIVIEDDWAEGSEL